MPPPKRRSSSSSSSKRTSSGSDCLPPPTTIGARNRWHSPTNPALNASAARSGPPHREITSRRRVHLPDGFRIEVSLDPRLGGGRSLQRLRIHDLVGRLPNLSEIPRDLRPSREGGVSFPDGHRLVHPAPVKIGADRALEGVDEPVHLLAGRSPVEVAILVRHVAVEGGDRGVAQLGHAVTLSL